MEYKIKSVLVMNHLLFLYGLIYYLSWMSLPLLILGYVCIIKLGVECGFHRLFSHRAFETTASRKNALLVLGSLAGFGPALAWAGVHRLHHRFSDTDQDPHGNLPAYKIWFTLWRHFTVPPESIKDLLKDRWQSFFFKNYFYFLGIAYLSVGILSPSLLFFGIAGASVLGFHAAGLVNTACHQTGESRNVKWVNFLVGGNGLHFNHHTNPTAWDYRLNKNDVDIQALFIKWFLKSDHRDLPATKICATPDL